MRDDGHGASLLLVLRVAPCGPRGLLLLLLLVVDMLRLLGRLVPHDSATKTTFVIFLEEPEI